MGLLLYYSLLKCLLFLILPNLIFIHCFSMQLVCRNSERTALLQLKESFILNKSASYYPLTYESKVSSWKLEGERGDCCSWDGVECDNKTGHVIALDLSGSFLYGSINSNSSLFQLLYLRRLNLSDNHFNYSKIPSAIANLSRLSHLDVSDSFLSGQIPPQVLELSKLVTLDLSGNHLELQKPSLKLLTEKLVNLRYLGLDRVKLSSIIPQSLANLSSMTYLSLSDCDLRGEFPAQIFYLPNLQILTACNNPNLSGHFPQFQNKSSIKSIILANTSFSGELPKSIGNLKSLSHFNVPDCRLSGLIPSSLANLTQLDDLDLSNNEFSPSNLPWLEKLSKLAVLQLGFTNSYGNIFSSLRNLTQLSELSLYDNKFSGRIPSWLGNLTQLINLDLNVNQFQGPIPRSIFTLVNLEVLEITDNLLDGTLKLESILNLEFLSSVQLDGNMLSLLTPTIKNVTHARLKRVSFGGCNLTEIPDFLSSQDELEYLDLSGNKIDGSIPEWIWGLSAQTLQHLDLSYNFLTDFNQPPNFPPWTNLRILDLSSNKLQGSLPIPPASIYRYSVPNNKLKGEISSLICNVASIKILDISNNSFSGMLPPCFGNLSKSLLVVKMHKNNFHGPVFQACEVGCKLRMIDLSQNRLSGQLPRSLVQCNMLELLNLGRNQIEDTFPFWLGMLRQLKILVLRHNGFYGAIGKPNANEFPKLQIIDLSSNKFTGPLPSHHFQSWEAMKVVDFGQLSYLQANDTLLQNYDWVNNFFYSITLTNKGVEEMEYDQIVKFLVAIDVSSNNFEGCIPQDIQILKEIQFLNLSNNFLSGSIPPSLANLTQLQSLDLSKNMLSGEIPQELATLTFLSFFNVSNNRLVGTIPQAKQFATFDNNSFDGNPGLCGSPLSRKCFSTSPVPSFSKKHEEGEESWLEICWKVALLGLGSGLVNGWVLGWYFFNPMRHKWLAKLFGRKGMKT